MKNSPDKNKNPELIPNFFRCIANYPSRLISSLKQKITNHFPRDTTKYKGKCGRRHRGSPS